MHLGRRNGGFLAQIDFEKAFDSDEWPFLIKCLEAFGLTLVLLNNYISIGYDICPRLNIAANKKNSICISLEWENSQN